MWNSNGQPMSDRKRVRILIALTILAWATQTLMHKIGYGQTLPMEPAEQFAQQPQLTPAGGTLEMRTQVTVFGSQVKLKQVCRWAESDGPAFAQLAELVVDHINGANTKQITLENLKTTLHDAGVNLALVRFAGAMACTVSRGDLGGGDRQALLEWIDQNQPKTAAATLGAEPAPLAPVTAVQALAGPTTAPIAIAAPERSLRDQLVADLSQRLNVPIDSLQVDFNAKDTGLLNLSEPNFHFSIQPRRVNNLGDVSWQIAVQTEGGSQNMVVSANARAWQNQITLVRAVAFRQVIREGDIEDRRVLVDRLMGQTLLTRAQTVGQEASRDLKPGAVMMAQSVEPVELAKSGQYVTVTLQQGAVQIKTVARAMEAGAYGQSIRVKNEATKDVFEVTLTGPQTAVMGPLSSDAIAP